MGADGYFAVTIYKEIGDGVEAAAELGDKKEEVTAQQQVPRNNTYMSFFYRDHNTKGNKSSANKMLL